MQRSDQVADFPVTHSGGKTVYPLAHKVAPQGAKFGSRKVLVFSAYGGESALVALMDGRKLHQASGSVRKRGAEVFEACAALRSNGWHVESFGRFATFEEIEPHLKDAEFAVFFVPYDGAPLPDDMAKAVSSMIGRGKKVLIPMERPPKPHAHYAKEASEVREAIQKIVNTGKAGLGRPFMFSPSRFEKDVLPRLLRAAHSGEPVPVGVDDTVRFSDAISGADTFRGLGLAVVAALAKAGADLEQADFIERGFGTAGIFYRACIRGAEQVDATRKLVRDIANPSGVVPINGSLERGECVRILAWSSAGPGRLHTLLRRIPLGGEIVRIKMRRKGEVDRCEVTVDETFLSLAERKKLRENVSTGRMRKHGFTRVNVLDDQDGHGDGGNGTDKVA